MKVCSCNILTLFIKLKIIWRQNLVTEKYLLKFLEQTLKLTQRRMTKKWIEEVKQNIKNNTYKIMSYAKEEETKRWEKIL